MIATSIISFYCPSLPPWMHMLCSCHSLCLEEGKPFGKKELWMHIRPAPTSTQLSMAKSTSWKSSKVKQNVTFHHQSWGTVCGGCHPWLLTPYHSCHHLSTILKATSRLLELLALFRPVFFPPSLSSALAMFLAMIQFSLSLTCHPLRPHHRETRHKMELNLPPSKG